MTDDTHPVLLRLPLLGEWTALRTPAAGVPTHGTDFLGQRFAYDFVRPTRRRISPFGVNVYRHALAVAPVSGFAAWDAPVVAAEAGTVIKIGEGRPDGRWVNSIVNLAHHFVVRPWRPVRITRNDWRALAGNYLVIEGAHGCAFYAHLRAGSLTVREGDHVDEGQLVGRVGNSGRSTMPHLHFHLMDRAAIDANGLPCGFAAFEQWDGSAWRSASGYPPRRAWIRA